MNECGWATLVMETDPDVLSTLLWIWLDKLKVRGHHMIVMTQNDAGNNFWKTINLTYADKLVKTIY